MKKTEAKKIIAKMAALGVISEKATQTNLIIINKFINDLKEEISIEQKRTTIIKETKPQTKLTSRQIDNYISHLKLQFI